MFIKLVTDKGSSLLIRETLVTITHSVSVVVVVLRTKVNHTYKIL